MNDRFPTTRPSLILAARAPEFRDEALAAIVDVYWKPVYKYLRLKWSRTHEDAQDLTQEFFASLLDHDLLARWEPVRASFRTYLRVCLDHQAANLHAAGSRLKRGGGAGNLVSLDFDAAERELRLAAPAASSSPEELFHREWQRRLFELGVSELRDYCADSGRGVQWQIFEAYDLAPQQAARPSYEDLALRHGVATTTVTNYLAWARRELRRTVLDKLARTTGTGAELRNEARDLFAQPGGQR